MFCGLKQGTVSPLQINDTSAGFVHSEVEHVQDTLEAVGES